jgi:hypothetical protein
MLKASIIFFAVTFLRSCGKDPNKIELPSLDGVSASCEQNASRKLVGRAPTVNERDAMTSAEEVFKARMQVVLAVFASPDELGASYTHCFATSMLMFSFASSASDSTAAATIVFDPEAPLPDHAASSTPLLDGRGSARSTESVGLNSRRSRRSALSL